MTHRSADGPCDTDLACARIVLAEYGGGLASGQIDRPSHARGFSGALILRVRIGSEKYCLRRWPRDGLPAKRLRELHHFLAHLQTSGIGQIAAPIMTERGETLPVIDGQLWQLEPWLPGTADFAQAATDARLRSAMHILARLHRAAERYVCRPTGRHWFAQHPSAPSPACSERLSIIRDWSEARCKTVTRHLHSPVNSGEHTSPPVKGWLGSTEGSPQLGGASTDCGLPSVDHSHPNVDGHQQVKPVELTLLSADAEFRKLAIETLRLYRIAQPSVERELASQRDVRYRLHPCLRDVWHDHLLFTGDELTGLVDPAAARTENVAADLSRLLGSLLADDRSRWEFALAAYSEVRPLSVDERQLVTTLDRSSVLLSGLTWIDRRLNGQLADADLPRVVPRLQILVARLQRLAVDR